jgi:hypothetical protein
LAGEEEEEQGPQEAVGEERKREEVEEGVARKGVSTLLVTVRRFHRITVRP